MTPARDEERMVAQTLHEYVAALRRADATGAQRGVGEAIAGGLPVAATYLDVLTPAMHEIGLLWERAEISIGDEHLATAITQVVLASLAGRLPRTPAAAQRVAVLGCGPGDAHGLGARMVGDFLAAAGWTVLDLGAATPAPAFAAVAAAHDAELVAVSSSRAEHLDGVQAVREALDALDRPPLMAVGGLGYDAGGARAAAVGADLFATDPARLLELLALPPATGPRQGGGLLMR